jgi:hypothetical protein
MSTKERIILPGNSWGRSIHLKVIPTVCNLKITIEKLLGANGCEKVSNKIQILTMTIFQLVMNGGVEK